MKCEPSVLLSAVYYAVFYNGQNSILQNRDKYCFSGAEVSGGKIRTWIHEQDLESLEKVLWEGEGFALLQHTTGHPKIKKFLEAAPRLMVSSHLLRCVHSLLFIWNC